MTPTPPTDRRTTRCRGLVVALACAALSAPVLASPALALPASPGTGPDTAVVVQATAGSLARAEAAVERAGGSVGRQLPVVAGFAARVPADRVEALRAVPGVRAVTPDEKLEPQSYSSSLGYDAASNTGSMYAVQALTGAQAAFKLGYAGKGVDVALIDSGVAPVQGLTSGNVVNGPDLSLDSQEPALRYNDGFGHGTHMASIIVGRDAAEYRPSNYVDQTRFTGMAPDARLVNVKVGAADGAVDVSQVLAGINWVIENRRSGDLNIRVINLSYGTNSRQPIASDPLAFAVEAAWKAGIVVVVSGGNDGNTQNYLGMPAQDPMVIAVGAQDPMGTMATGDDTVPAWASKGDTGGNNRFVDLIAPGVHVLGLRAPNSMLDYDNPGARTGTRFLRGNGTSQAAAVVSGAVALYLQKYPSATPDEVKLALTQSAHSVGGAKVYQGTGAIDVNNALHGAVPNNKQGSTGATGTGSLEQSRGTVHVVDYADGTTATPTVLTGEKDIFGNAFSSSSWAGKTAVGTTWQNGAWLGSGLAGDGWTGSSWASRTWSSRTWSGLSWASRTWSSRTWSSRTWSGGSWDSRTWSGRTWSGAAWSSRTWSGDSWSGVGWQ